MTIRDIITTKSPNSHRLREPSHTVARGTDVTQLVQDLRDTLRANSGVGIAAPQIGVPLKVCVVECGGISVAMVNPEIRVYRDYEGKEARGPLRIVAEQEGCLSLPGQSFFIVRPPAITVTYRTARGAKVRQTFTGLASRAIAHEVDHLHGILAEDRSAAQNKMRKDQSVGARPSGGVQAPLTVDDLLPQRKEA